MSFPVSTNFRALDPHNTCAHRLPRIAIALTLFLSMLLPGLAIAHVTAQDEASNDVAMFRGNPARTGELPGPGPDPNEAIVLHWTFHTDAYIQAAPAVANGVLYLGSTDGNLYAIDAATGEQKWALAIGWTESPPTVVDGVVYIGSSDNNLFAIDAESGQQIWMTEFDQAITERIVASPVVVDGIVYIGSSYGGLFALDAATGKEIWNAELGSIAASAAVADGIVYIIQQDARLLALDAATGEERWLFEGGDSMGFYLTSPAVADGTVYAFTNYNGNLYAIDTESGQPRWEFHIPIESMNWLSASPAVANGTVYLGGSNGLYAIDAATGQERWAFPSEPMLEVSPVVVDGIVYAASSNIFYAIDAESGEEQWTTPTDSKMGASPTVANGVIFLPIGSRLIAIGNPTPAMQTATAEAHATETAVANAYATQVAVANITATAQSYLDATTTAIAGQTATAEAQAFATSEAIQRSWDDYFWTDIYDALATGVAEFPGMSVDRTSKIRIAESYVPQDYAQIAYYAVPIQGGTASAMVLLAIFPSKDHADAAMENISGGLIRSGWETQDVKELDHNHICLTVEHSSSSEALCYMTRDDALIISYSAVALPKPESALLNAVDLAKTMDHVYDEVDRPV